MANLREKLGSELQRSSNSCWKGSFSCAGRLYLATRASIVGELLLEVKCESRRAECRVLYYCDDVFESAEEVFGGALVDGWRCCDYGAGWSSSQLLQQATLGSRAPGQLPISSCLGY